MAAAKGSTKKAICISTWIECMLSMKTIWCNLQIRMPSQTTMEERQTSGQCQTCLCRPLIQIKCNAYQAKEHSEVGDFKLRYKYYLSNWKKIKIWNYIMLLLKSLIALWCFNLGFPIQSQNSFIRIIIIYRTLVIIINLDL